MTRFFPFILCIAGCGRPSNADQIVDLFEELAAAAEENKDDCPRMGAVFERLTQRSSQLLKEAVPNAAERSLGPRLNARRKAAIGRLTRFDMKCATNEKVKVAILSL